MTGILRNKAFSLILFILSSSASRFRQSFLPHPVHSFILCILVQTDLIPYSQILSLRKVRRKF